MIPNCPDDFDVVFFSTPDGVGQQGASQMVAERGKVVDYSGDFRFDDPKVYEGYAKAHRARQSARVPGTAEPVGVRAGGAAPKRDSQGPAWWATRDALR
jgi:hypothetical protein